MDLTETPLAALIASAAFVALALAALAAALYKLEFSKAARRRRRLHEALARAERARAASKAGTAPGSPLTPDEVRRLQAFRTRARMMVDEPLTPLPWHRKLRLLWRDGYSGWILAALVGAFSMATHFGAFWLIAGGGWLGATLITLLSTILMVAACFWVLIGLVAPD